MVNGRRTFLGKTLAGLGTLLGFMGANKVFAFHRRPIYYVPCPPMMPCPCEPKAGLPATISYPPNSAAIPGGGGFYVWGNYDSTKLKFDQDHGSATITFANGNQSMTASALSAPPTGSSSSTFAFEFSGVPYNNQAPIYFSLAVSGLTYTSGPMAGQAYTPTATGLSCVSP